MPPRQTYGKRSRAVYDPHAVLASPARKSPAAAEVSVAEVVEELGLLSFGDEVKGSGGRRKRGVLGEVSVNVDVGMERSLGLSEDGGKKGQGGRREVVLYEEAGHSAVEEDHDDSLELIGISSHDMISFQEWADQLCAHFELTKIAEASFGEVYRLSLRERISGIDRSDESVFKIIALRPSESTFRSKRKPATSARQTTSMSSPADVANEVKLLQRMSAIPGFTNFRDLRIVQGRPPAVFAQAYKAFNAAQQARNKDLSHFPDPGKRASYASDQLWAVIEMQDAGIDLERLVEQRQSSTSIFFVWDVFWQVVLSLAKGEEGAEFEHRDLHLGNICVHLPAANNDGPIDAKRKLNFTDVETTIIDYTISRCRMQDDNIAYHDLARDSALFEGDSSEEYQYDIYRYMRGAALCGDPYAAHFPAESEDGRWMHYHPITNLIWLHYILYKLLEQVAWPSAERAPSRKRKEEYARWKRGNDLEYILLSLQDLLDPGRLCEAGELGFASDLVGLALEEGWLDVEDVVGGAVEEEEVEDGGVSGLFEQLERLNLAAE
ncbi:hypothetical protein BDY17DRAFT_311233 [Neohortaea acidophila]|uniref:non-specific serine/threonine protein kinase n=1 Tax=Neohortaea acidophila TaxID=245834 RepID=A0A6A6PRS0_9PEZI|nr:uncharacterized protein BDY17DRAFT_311233 [Neohortaea acidophila]KAF2482828.1 hypothetical protein BDY17DRAFT_311233 [Neohortaea acidophila]